MEHTTVKYIIVGSLVILETKWKAFKTLKSIQGLCIYGRLMFPEPGAMLNGGGELNQLRAVERLGSYCSCSSHSIEEQRRQQGISRRAPPVWDARDAKIRASASVAHVALTRLSNFQTRRATPLTPPPHVRSQGLSLLDLSALRASSKNK